MDMQKNVKVNFKYKDSLFRFIFRDKAALLTLYNAVNDSDYTDPEALEIYCIVQFKAHMVNINMGKNSKLMERCPLLYEYSVFVSEIRKRISQNALLREAVESAVDYCIHNGILADVLRGNRAEVTDMCLEEYDAAFHIASEKEISFEEGRQEERRNTERERQRADELELKNAVLVGKLRGETEEAIAKSRGITLKEVKRILEEV